MERALAHCVAFPSDDHDIPSWIEVVSDSTSRNAAYEAEGRRLVPAGHAVGSHTFLFVATRLKVLVSPLLHSATGGLTASGVAEFVEREM